MEDKMNINYKSANKYFNLKLCISLIALLIIYHIYFMVYPTHIKTDLISEIIFESQRTFKIKLQQIEILPNSCFEHKPRTLEEFSTLLKYLKKVQPKNCEYFSKKFEAIYEVEERFSDALNIPSNLQKQFKKSLHLKDLSLLNKQKLIIIFNLLTFEQSVFNPLRARRPLPKEKDSIWHYVDSLVSETRKDCDFCNYLNKTSCDQFGRSETLFTVRVSNSFKMDRWHGMILAKSHNPINISAEVFETMLEDAYKWTREIQQVDPTYNLPNLGMDILSKSGASQIHPHIHLLMSPNHYLGPMEMLRSVAANHLKKTGRNYFNDLVQIYSTLDLAISFHSAVALPMITGKGDMEVLILSEQPNKDLYRLLYFVVKAYKDSFQQVCYSTSMAWPPVVSSNVEFELPALIRIMSRGNCQSKMNDISNFDIYMMNSLTHDPWDVARAIQKAVKDDSIA